MDPQSRSPVAQVTLATFWGDDNCGMLSGIREVLTNGTPMDFQDFAHPLFRLVVARDVFDLRIVDRAPTLVDVVAILQGGAACNGGTIGTSGPAMMLTVTPQALLASMTIWSMRRWI